MAIYTMGQNSLLYLDQYRLTSGVREGSLQIGTEALDKTAWGDTARVFRGGLNTIQLSASGHQNFAAAAGPSGGIDPVLSAEMSADSSVITVGADSASAGDIVYSMEALASSYVPIQGAVGDLGSWALEAMGAGNWFRGVVLRGYATTFASSQSTGQQLGTIAATANMYAALHIFSMSGGMTFDAIIQSDDNASFTSATTRMTFAQATGVGSQFLGPTAGPGGSDNYWRTSWTVTGSGTIIFAVTFCPGGLSG